MIFLCTKNNLIGSHAIRWGLDEESSHFAVCFFEDYGDTALVLESRLGHGVSIGCLGHFRERNEIVRALQFPMASTAEEFSVFHTVHKRLHGRKYDQAAILYWALVALTRKYLGMPIPNRNELGRNELVYCVEVLEAMPEFLADLGIYLDDFDLEMTSPEMIYKILLDTGLLLDISGSF